MLSAIIAIGGLDFDMAGAASDFSFDWDGVLATWCGQIAPLRYNQRVFLSGSVKVKNRDLAMLARRLILGR